ncbi:bifunctional glycosyltransferase/CDP-glycerol:glycerophosphate glycerophosphotransferase [Humibacillus xanthopallidus]|uniref:CDP-glycerol glycerophosphotransferase n=1 Tax=Humibacillus xanthopallidus TaxID=412689 RepID=A0A543I0A3_9MICO|nr:CDP-glycerol glycerophosphotransferase family protein [Humibacillus xanthopallidus]TQM63895.1 CDP-glycerol glycerophosphotransferase [Humibacillus xanthopallidus]
MHAVRRSIPHHRWEAVRDRLHPALRQTLAAALTPSTPSLGRVSVIVPCYNVEEYLPDCLDSIIGQKYRDLEIIVVIDGSPDASAEIARGYARWDRRVTVVEQPNAGLGAARNTGIRAARGEFIAFVDSDDTLPPKAIATMVSCLSTSGSDFVVGNLQRRNAARSWVPAWAQEVHRRDRTGLTLDEFPEVLADVFAWNKLFRRSFFDRAVGSFPEGIRYEDQEPSAKAYASAAAFDVLHEVVYSWYVRGDGTSITQQKSNIVDLADRLTVMSNVADVLRERASAKVRHEWQAKSVGLDLRAYYNEVPRTGDDYWHALASGVHAVTKDMDDHAWGLVSLHDRLLARMVEQGHRDDIRIALRRRNEVGDAWETDLTVEPPQARPLYLEDLQTYRPTASDLALTDVDNRMRIVGFGYEVDGDELVVSGMAWVPGLDLASTPSTLEAHLVDETVEGPHTPDSDIVLSVERFDDATLDELAGWSSPSQATTGFRVRIDLADLAAALEARHPAVDDVVESHPGWHLELELAVARPDGAFSHRWRSPLTSWDRRWTGNDLEVSPLHDGKRVVALHSAARGVHFHLFAPQVTATTARLEGRDLHLVATTTGPDPITEFTLSCGKVGLRRSFPAVAVDGGYEATLAVPPLPLGASPVVDHQWGVRAVVGGESLPIVWAGSTGELSRISPHTSGLRLGVFGPGRVRLLDRKLHATVHRVDVADDLRSFTVTGYAAADVGAQPRLALVSHQGTGLWTPEDVRHDLATGRFDADFSLTTQAWGTTVARATGAYSLRLLHGDGDVDRAVWLPVAPHAVDDVSPRFLHWHRAGDIAFRFTLTSRARALWVNTRSAVPEEDWNRAGQWSMRRGIPALLSSPIEDGVLFSTFGGRSAGDSPLALHDELVRRDYPHRLVWEVADGTSVVPDGAETVVIGTREHLRALHTSRHLVANNNFPFYYRKHPDQTYLQTWHGTPLKKIGQHVPAQGLSLSYRDLMSREAKAWDLLLAQNDFASTTLPEALEFEGEVLNVGYPRNDLLSTGSDADRARIRTRLGVSRDARLVLYAPTWRDNVRTATGGYAMVNHLELDAVSHAFGADSVLLVRGHSNTPGLGDATASNVVDVSRYPDITELMLVADVLVTDYSSIMFDFASTRRPMLFLTPDLAEYAGSTRGFYLDFAEIAPGPLLTSTDEVLRSLTALPQLETTYADRYDTFRTTFAPRDDGRAAARVVDAVWGR